MTWYRDLPGADQFTGDPERAAAAILDDRRAAPAPRIITTAEALDEWVAIERLGDAGTIKTGWPTIDRGLHRAIRPGEVVVIAARTGVGKTWAALGTCLHALEHDPQLCALVQTLEMPGWQMAERLAAMALTIPPGTAARRAQSENMTEAVLGALGTVAPRLSWCDETIGPSRLEEARVAAGRPGLVIVDYLGLLAWEGQQSARTYERASENVKLLKAWAKQERIIVLVATQLGREGGGDGSREPHLNDLRDSGVIEEASDRVLMLWRTDESEQVGGGARIHAKIAKNRFGPTGYRTTLIHDVGMRLREHAHDPGQQRREGGDGIPVVVG